MPALTASVPLLDQPTVGVTPRLAPALLMLPALLSVPGLRLAVASAPTVMLPEAALAKLVPAAVRLPAATVMEPLLSRLAGLSARLPAVTLSTPLFVRLPGLSVSVCESMAASMLPLLIQFCAAELSPMLP